MRRSATPSWTRMREPAQQTWPWLNQIASTTPSTTLSRSASSKTMKGDLPPSSSESFLPAARGGLADDAADLGRAGEGDLVDAGMRDQRLAGAAVAGDDVDHARRQPDLARTARRSASAVSEVNSAGLSTTVLPIASAGAIFQASISSGKFQGMICPTTPTGTAAGQLALHELGPAGVVVEVAGHQRDVDVPRSRGSACRCRAISSTAKQPAVLLDLAGEGVEVAGPAVPAERPPARLRGARRRAPRASTSAALAWATPGERLAGGRVRASRSTRPRRLGPTRRR